MAEPGKQAAGEGGLAAGRADSPTGRPRCGHGRASRTTRWAPRYWRPSARPVDPAGLPL